MPDYSYVVSPTFNPFNMQEMLVPFSAYKDAFEKSEEQYNDLADRSDKFKYLSETLPEGSKARQIYEGYANELRTQAEDFAHNGLTMGNRRALTSLKRRYQGEIGRLLEADEAMREEKKLRRSINAQDHSMLYADDNLNIDNFLDGNTPNLYSVSGNELYARGAEAGKAASSRMVNVGEGNITLGGYYRDLVSKYGYSPELLAKFRQDMNTIPELKASLDDYMEASGVNQNLSGYNRDRATQYYLQGVLNGAIYQENHNPQRDLGVLTKAEQVADARAKQQMELQRRGQDISLASQGLTYNPKTGKVSYDPNNDPSLQKASAIATIKAQTSGNKGNSKTSAYDVRNKGITMVGAKSGTKYKSVDDADNVIGTPIEDLSKARALSSQEYSKLVDSYGNITNENLRSAIGNGNLSDYEIYILPKGSEIKHHWYRPNEDSDEDIYIAIPRESKRAATDGTVNISGGVSTSGSNDIPE